MPVEFFIMLLMISMSSNPFFASVFENIIPTQSLKII